MDSPYWVVSSLRYVPGDAVGEIPPGVSDPKVARGPVSSHEAAIALASSWRNDEGKRSALYLIRVEFSTRRVRGFPTPDWRIAQCTKFGEDSHGA